MKILILPLKKEWFDMILSGVKKEEYRKVKKHWQRRLLDGVLAYFENPIKWIKFLSFKEFDAVEFRNGYSKNCRKMLVECKGITIGEPKPEWSGGMTGEHFIIHLGKILKTRNEYARTNSII